MIRSFLAGINSTAAAGATLSGDVVVGAGDKIALRYDPNGGDRTVKDTFVHGAARGRVLENAGSANTLTLTDVNDNTIGRPLAAGESALYLGDGTTARQFMLQTSEVGRQFVMDPGIGGDYIKQVAVAQDVTVNTSGAATTITLSIPSGARVVGYAFNIPTAISGSDATGATLALTGGLTTSLATGLALTANTKSKGFLDENAAGVITSATTNASLTLTGGTPTNPSAGAVSLVVYYETIANLDDDI